MMEQTKPIVQEQFSCTTRSGLGTRLGVVPIDQAVTARKPEVAGSEPRAVTRSRSSRSSLAAPLLSRRSPVSDPACRATRQIDACPN